MRTHMHKHLYISLLLGFLLLAGVAEAQNLRLNHIDRSTHVNFDLSRLYNYNVYERNRWGLGFNVSAPIQHDKRYGTDFQNLVFGEVYGAWGSGDHGWKYGATAGLLFPRHLFRGFYVGYMHDVEMAGQHSFATYNLLNTVENSTYSSSRYSELSRLFANMQLHLPGKSDLTLSYRHSAERLLFDENGLLYPYRYGGDALPLNDYDEMELRLQWNKHWTLDLLGGVYDARGCGDGTLRRDNLSYMRLLAQYSRNIKIDSVGTWRLFCQAGSTLDQNTPVSRRFDLSGTGNSYYYFRNSLLTVRPNTFMADAFVQAGVSFTMAKPLWNTKLSKPLPFAQLNAVWGGLWNGRKLVGTGLYELQSGMRLNSGNDCQTGGQYIEFVAPDHGLIEPAIGVNNLIRWKLLDIGGAVAYQLTPGSALYHRTAFTDNLALLFIATLIIDN